MCFRQGLDVVVISSEMFWLMGPQSVQLTRDIIVRHCPSVLVIVFIRNFGRWVAAWTPSKMRFTKDYLAHLAVQYGASIRRVSAMMGLESERGLMPNVGSASDE